MNDGEKVRVSLLFMDAKTVLDDGLIGGLHRPGYRYIATDAAAVTRIQEARDAYEKDLCSRWCTSDAKEGDACDSA